MKIFYIELKNTSELKRVEKRKLQSALGRYLTKQIAEVFYNIQDTEIIIENDKPKFKNSEICFNISHTENVVAIAFNDKPLGLDVEYIKERDFKTLFARFNIDLDDKDLFYQFWTEYEAEYKIQAETKQKICFKLLPDYMLSLFSSNPDCGIKTKLKIYEIKSPTDNITPNELINLKLVKASNKNENTLVAQERNTAEVEFFTPLDLKTE